MAFNISTNKVATKRLIKVVETKVLGRLSTEEGVERTLEGFGRVNIINEDKVGESIQFSGVVTIDALFSSLNKTIQSGQVSLDFNERVSLGVVESVALIPSIKEVKLTKETEDQIQIMAVVETKIYAVVEEDIDCLTGETEGYYANKSKVCVNQLFASANTSFNKTLTIDGDYKVLSTSFKTIVSNVTPFDNYCLIEGSCAVELLVLEGEQIKKLSKTVDLSEEVAVLNLSSNSLIDFNVFDKSVNVSSSGENDGIVVDLLVGVCVWGYEVKEVDIITDCFSVQKALDLTYSNFNTYEVKESQFFSERKNLVIDVESKKRMDEIIYIGIAESKIEEIRPEDGEIKIMGQTKIPVIYKNYDSDEYQSVNLYEEFDFSLPVDLSGLDYNIDIQLSSIINSFKNKAGKDISLMVDYEGFLSYSLSKTEQCLLKIEEGEVFQNNKDAIIVYKPIEGETVFEMAKNLHTDPNVILAQNPQLDDGNFIDQVIVYRSTR